MSTARAFLRAHADRLASQKLRRNLALTPTDLEELERLLVEAGGSPQQIAGARDGDRGLGASVHSLVGLDRSAAKDLFNEFLVGGTASASQIEFIALLINHLTEQGVVSAARLYESPLTDISQARPEGVFSLPQVERIVAILDGLVTQTA